jgi:hypothetical protein
MKEPPTNLGKHILDFLAILISGFLSITLPSAW